jgi:hypothetical protein
MRRKEPQLCADCGAPSTTLLCDRCAEVCDILTPAGRYYTYRRELRSGHVRPLVPKAAADLLHRRSSPTR